MSPATCRCSSLTVATTESRVRSSGEANASGVAAPSTEGPMPRFREMAFADRKGAHWQLTTS